MNLPIIIVGAGGHAKVVADALLMAKEQVEGFTDAAPSKWGTAVMGIPVLGADEMILSRDSHAILLANGIGSTASTAKRRGVFLHFRERGYRFITIVHPRAIIANSASLGEGVQVMAGAIIQAGAVVGENTIVNTAASVDHDCNVGPHCHLAPGCILSGGITIGEGSHIGTGASVKQGINLGPNTIVAVGAAVAADHSGHATLVGVPARPRT